MEDDPGSEADEDVPQLRRSHVELMDLDLTPTPGIGEARQHPGREVVDHQHLGSVVDEAVDQVGPDETGSAGDDGT